MFESCVFICLLGLTCVSHVTPSSECTSPLGMEDGRIKDSQITASGFANGKTTYSWQARLCQNITNWGAWCANISGGSPTERNYDQYIQIDLLKVTIITKIATQGREHAGGKEYVKDYKISYSNDSRNWIFYRGKDQTSNEAKILQGNTNVSSVERRDLDPTIMARYIRVHPGYDQGNHACMRLELYGCVVEKVILSYSMPVGQKTRNGKVDYKDTTYTGVITNDFYKDGTGILTDGKFGPVDAKSLKGEGWVGWNSNKTEYIDIIFEFSCVRKFKNVTLTVNVDKGRSNAVFDKSQIFFASTKDGFSNTSFLQYCPRGYEAQDDPFNANVTLSLCENTARFIKLRLYFGAKWLVITEISFNSVPASTDGKRSLQNCSRNTTVFSDLEFFLKPSQKATMESSRSATTGTSHESTTNSTTMFVAIAVTFVVLIIILFIIVMICKIRRQASKLSTAVNTVEMQNETAQTADDSPNDERYSFGVVASRAVGVFNRGLDHHATPADCGTTQNEEVHISPRAVHVDLNRNLQDGREINSDRGSGHGNPSGCHGTAPYEEVMQISPPSEYVDLTKNLQGTNSDHGLGCVIPANSGRVPAPYEEVQIWPPSEYVEFKGKLRDGRKTNSDRGLDCVNPANRGRAANGEVKISPLSEYIEFNRNLQGPREINSDRGLGCVNPANSGRAVYEEVKISPLSGYAELDKNLQRQDRKDHGYQKLLKHDSGYVIPIDTAEPSVITTPGYTQLDDTKREQKDDASYQKLIKK